MQQFLEKQGYKKSLTLLTFLLLPFSWLFRIVVALRYFFYRTIKKPKPFPVPIIVVGNLTVGGTGKTPFVIWLAECLRRAGYRPGIVSRGVGGEKLTQPYWVSAIDSSKKVGDESLLLARRTACPLVVCVDRVAAVRELLQKTDCNIVISDDGLQHYRLARTLEIVIIDGARQFGNRQLLPAGPLREPLARLQTVDLVVTNGEHAVVQTETMQLQGELLSSLISSDTRPLLDLKNKTVHAIAGIGNPQRFFSMLKNLGIHVLEHAFPDHYLYQRKDIDFADELPVIMTEKDAVKCTEFANKRHWYLRVDAVMSPGIEKKILGKLK